MALIPTDGFFFFFNYQRRAFLLRSRLLQQGSSSTSPSFAFQGLYYPLPSLNVNMANLFTWVSLGSRLTRGLFGLMFTFEVKAMESLSHSFFPNMLAHLFQGFHIPWEVVLSKVNFKVKQILAHLAVCPMCFFL